LREAVALVPRDAPVTSTTAVGGHLAARRYAYVVPVVRRAEWIVVDTSDSWRPLAYGGVTDPAGLRDFLVRVERDRTWKPVFEREGVLVFRKGYP
jgi:uncharacterized membrane protein